MKLFYSPGACSLSPHIVLKEAGINCELEQVDLKTKKTKGGADFNAINPKGYVPTLVLDNGKTLTEGPAIVQYLADLKPASGLAPAAGTFERYRLQEALNFISTELHKGFSPLFNPATPDETRKSAVAAVSGRFAAIDRDLGKGGPFLLGSQFTVADAYLFVMTTWTSYVKIDLGQWPNVKAYSGRVAARPKVQEALKEEGLA
ncbi:MAG: glutathione transferase GstA [Candidatus Binataceae bacterium]